MKYIWINPVTESMYTPAALSAFLQKNGYTAVTVSTNWINIVKEKYKAAVADSSLPVMDMRCPKILELVKESGISSAVTIPEIEPILIHCGREISQREDLRGTEKIITTPCKALADMGNALALPETTFLPWNEFLRITGSEPTATSLEKSPIPPGFFEGLGFSHHSVTGETEIRELFQSEELHHTDLVELLFCKDGCHNGDGVKISAN